MKPTRLLTISLSAAVVLLIFVFFAVSNSNSMQSIVKTSSISSNTNSSQSSSSEMVINLGEPLINKTKLIYANAYVQFVSSEKFPLTIYSPKVTDMELTMLNVPKGVWIKFVPEHIQVGPNGSSVIMLMSGAVKPFVSTNRNTTLTIIDKTSDYMTSTTLPIVQTENMTILNSIGAINFPNAIMANQNGSFATHFGVVYDPNTNDSRNQLLFVNLSIAGLLKDGKISPLPPWFKFDIPENPILLTPDRPSYFVIGVQDSSAPVGTYTILIDENVNGHHFTNNLQVNIMPQVRI